MTLDPTKHFDPMGLFFFVFAHFGWAKPIPINPYNFKNQKWGTFWTSIAGILVNYLSAFLVFYPLRLLTVEYVLPIFAGKYMALFLYMLTELLYAYSISFAVFNFLPIYPLDGFRIFETFCGNRSKVLNYLRSNGSYILMGLIVINILSQYLPILKVINVLGIAMEQLGGWLSSPIIAFWGLIF